MKPTDLEEILSYSGVDDDQLKSVSSGPFVTLLSFISGAAHAKVMACGEIESFEAYRSLYAQGRDISTRHKLAMKTKAMNPDKANVLEDVDKKVTEWKIVSGT